MSQKDENRTRQQLQPPPVDERVHSERAILSELILSVPHSYFCLHVRFPPFDPFESRVVTGA
jgi:hypothetical protein